jgi:hypothetical protein
MKMAKYLLLSDELYTAVIYALTKGAAVWRRKKRYGR